MEAASKGLDALTNLVQSAQGSARQALQSTSSTNKIASAGGKLNGSTLLTSADAGTFTAGKVIKVNGATVLTVGATSTIRDLVDGINNNNTPQPGRGGDEGAGLARHQWPTSRSRRWMAPPSR